MTAGGEIAVSNDAYLVEMGPNALKYICNVCRLFGTIWYVYGCDVIVNGLWWMVWVLYVKRVVAIVLLMQLECEFAILTNSTLPLFIILSTDFSTHSKMTNLMYTHPVSRTRVIVSPACFRCWVIMVKIPRQRCDTRVESHSFSLWTGIYKRCLQTCFGTSEDFRHVCSSVAGLFTAMLPVEPC